MPRVNPSSPVYNGLQPDAHARAHLIVVDANGAPAVIDLFARADACFAGRATLLGCGPHDLAEKVRPRDWLSFPDRSALLRGLVVALEQTTMGTTIYVAGTMAFIGEVARVAAEHGIAYASLRTERCGPLEQRVQCVHCKFILERVLTPTVVCSQCKLNLLIRDHYSHRLNAFMGVCSNAETLL